MNLEDGGL
uniref:Uncharacterized protein n=1 Tax=Anguilla anguilla TaxID=7936 RepID=A0A0E9P8D8_ANGAN